QDLRMQEKDFLKKFDKFVPTPEQEEILRGNFDYTVLVDKNNRAVLVKIRFDEIISKSLLIETENSIRDAYHINYVRIVPSYPPALFSEEYIPSALQELERRGAVSRGFFRDCTYSYNGDKITLCVKIPDGGVSLLDDAKTADCFSEIIRDEFGLDIKTEIRQPDGFDFSFDDYFEDMRRREEEYLSEAPPPPLNYSVNEAAKEDKNEPAIKLKRVTSLYGKGELAPEKIGDGLFRCGNTCFDVSSPETIYGEPFELTDPLPLRNVDRNGLNVCVFGKLIFCETREFRNSERVSVSFAITDEDSSIFCRVSFDSTNEANRLLDRLMKDGSANTDLSLAVSGRVRADKNDGELSINVSGIAVIGCVKRSDKSSRKRVELHLHTKMSAMDALIPPDEVIKTAERWGHSAIAITDHGNVQGYQEAMVAFEKLVEKKGDDRALKNVIYGMEGYFVDDTSRAVYGDADADFETDEFCIFDIETTGLSSHRDRIIEIGAVIFKGGKMTDVFCTYVDPGMPIPENITNLTGIKNSDVEGAPSQREAVGAFLRFAGDRILVAHNALFDVGFIRKACEDNGIDFANTYMDTVAMSRYINPELSKHKLDNLAVYFGLGDFNHHRASDDAEMLALIFAAMTEKFAATGIKTVAAMSSVMAEKIDVLRLPVYHIIILVKNKTGLKNLYRLVSKSFLDYYRRFPRIPKTQLARYRDGLIIGSACSEGQLFSAMLENRSRSDLIEMAEFYDYIEIQPLSNNGYLIANGTASGRDDLIQLNKELVSIAEEAGKPVCATCDAHFSEPYDEIYRKILLAGMKYQDADRDAGLYLRTTEEMLEEFSYLG
ncbi:MAG: PHP domain-containing protein, partial [Clostridia bacterium]|nr:PHP domain-containing protein [Clostridia bacterium]